jgi:hypothetical protein
MLAVAMSKRTESAPKRDIEAPESPSTKIPFKLRAERMSKELLDNLNRNVRREQNDPTYKPPK